MRSSPDGVRRYFPTESGGPGQYDLAALRGPDPDLISEDSATLADALPRA